MNNAFTIITYAQVHIPKLLKSFRWSKRCSSLIKICKSKQLSQMNHTWLT